MISVTEEGLIKLKEAGVNCPGLKAGMRIHPQIVFEPPAQITKSIRWDTPVQIGAFSMIHASGEVVAANIGRYCSFAPGVTLGANEHPIDWLTTSSLAERPGMFGWDKSGAAAIPGAEIPNRSFSESIRPILIGNDVWIGQGAFIRGGVKIGDGAIVGSMANVISDVPAYAIVAGNPARLIRYRFDHEKIVRLLKLRWWEYSIFDFKDVDITSSQCLDKIEKLVSDGVICPFKPNRMRVQELFI